MSMIFLSITNAAGRVVGDEEKFKRSHCRIDWRFGTHARLAFTSLQIQVNGIGLFSNDVCLDLIFLLL